MKSQTLPTSAPARDPLPRTAKSSGSVSRSTFEPAAPASRRNVGHRSDMWPVFTVHSSHFECYSAQETPKTRSTVLPAAQSLHMGLYAHICDSECAAGSPTKAATAAREHFGTELALLAGRGAHKTQKTRSRALFAGQPHHMGLYAHICTSKCAAGSPTTAAAAAREHFGHAWRRGHVAAALTRRKPTKVRASEPHLVSGRARPRAC